MKFLLRSLPKPPRRTPHHQHRTLIDAAAIKCVRDRALDHAVEKERNLKSLLSLKTLISTEPTKSLPLSVISQHRHSLRIPIRPIDFIRQYPSIFHEFLPGNVGITPHVKLTPEVLDLDAEESLIYHSESHKQDAANRLLKLLMIGKINRIPLRIIDCLKWDLGLPQDYTKSIVPEFPDYFKVTSGNDESLELVCWSNELAKSVIEKKERGYEKGMPIAFPLQYSRGFEIDKKFKKSVDEWQKLPYISPYENALHLSANSDKSDRWAVAVLHELLHLFVPKKTERDNILFLGEYLGIRSRLKRALLNHPGIFYVSSKVRTHTVVLREAYKRDLLIGNDRNHPLMGMRSKYIHLMNMVKKDTKGKNVQGGRSPNAKMGVDSNEGEGEELEDDDNVEEQGGKLNGSSNSELEDDSADDDDVDEEEDEDASVMIRGRTNRKGKIEEGGHFEAVPNRSVGRNFSRTRDRSPPRNSRRRETAIGRIDRENHLTTAPTRSARRNSSRRMDTVPYAIRTKTAVCQNDRGSHLTTTPNRSARRYSGKPLDRSPTDRRIVRSVGHVDRGNHWTAVLNRPCRRSSGTTMDRTPTRSGRRTETAVG